MTGEKRRKSARDSKSVDADPRVSMTGADRMTENADLSDTGVSGSTSGDRTLNYGMGDEGVPVVPGAAAAGTDTAAGEEAGTRQDAGKTAASEGGGSRQVRSGGQSSESQGNIAGDRHGGGSREARSGGSEDERASDEELGVRRGGGSRDLRSGGATDDKSEGDALKTHRTRRSSH